LSESDSAATKAVRVSTEGQTVPGINDAYLREQLEQRRKRLQSALSSASAAEADSRVAPLFELLGEVDSALRRMDQGTYGICDLCHDTVEKERLIADPLVRLCLDHLSSEEQRALERDLELASRVQHGLLPAPNLYHDDWRIHYRYKPAGLVSGDYCDLILPAADQESFLFLVGDVAGKGVAASLLMTHLHAMFRTLSGLALDLRRLLDVANRVFCESTLAGQYATLVCGRAGREGRIEIASAGHFPALHVMKDGVKQIAATGLPLGMFATSSYTIERVHLKPGDTLLLYTDGILEAIDPSGKEYGIDALSRVTSRGENWSPQELVAACLMDVERHSAGAKQADDQTLMAIHRSRAAGQFAD
jgi:phosphoserine phosphatase RsbU/P